jgi:hypothetical protein
MTNNTSIIILGVILVFTTLTNFPTESHEDRRHVPHDTYAAIGKLLTCDDVKASSFFGMLIRETLDCSSTTGGITLSADVENSLRISMRDLFRNHTSDNPESSSNQSLNYTALAELLTCDDINPKSEHGPTLMNMLGCQDINNENSTGR